jgi:serine/threonine-protein kinase HipA
MAIGRDGFRASNLAGCVAWAHAYGVDRREARDLVERQVEVVRSAWDDAADRARLTAADRRAALGGPILHPSIFYGWDDVK